ncbi:hypothetical protein MNBD_GAMMA13-58 [hydrothermal vent metagenome]|uniref:Uncharacterized protein n=1 Tax=hydrothermal vent metagenome TaxID=652676 RepID=A0A3B0YM55_9ZZZZ
MKSSSPALRISVGLVLLTISFLLLAELFGLTPNPAIAILDARKKVCESLAVQLSVAATHGDIEAIRETVRALVERNADVLSASLRSLEKEKPLAVSGEHERYWERAADTEISTPTQAIVPIFRGEERWGSVEVRFAPLYPTTLFGIELTPLAKLVGFVALVAFGGFLVFMRRTLRHLDPSALVPARVKFALDALAEGVVLMDKQGRVMLANKAYLKNTGRDEQAIQGTLISEWPWLRADNEQVPQELPWMRALRKGHRQTGINLILEDATGEQRTFVVNASPVEAKAGEVRGVLATFDDVTELENKNLQLEKTLNQLQRSRNELRLKNQQLEILATQDSLTGCLNRRAFFKHIDHAIAQARRTGTPIACIMVDIDHFKRVNDTWGHATGDKVIKHFSALLGNGLRDADAIGRYGGEEFCLLLWDNTMQQALHTAERLRAMVEASPAKPPVTGSFGVSCLNAMTTDTAMLINQADKALYTAKQSGRNKVNAARTQLKRLYS